MRWDHPIFDVRIPSTENRIAEGNLEMLAVKFSRRVKSRLDNHREDGDAQSPPLEEVREASMERLY